MSQNVSSTKLPEDGSPPISNKCALCQEQMSEDQELLIIRICRHVFHLDCIENLDVKKCAVCTDDELNNN